MLVRCVVLKDFDAQAVLNDEGERLPFHSCREAFVQRAKKLMVTQRDAGGYAVRYVADRTASLWGGECLVTCELVGSEICALMRRSVERAHQVTAKIIRNRMSNAR